MTEQTYTMAFELEKKISQRTRDLRFIDIEPDTDEELKINLQCPEILVSKGTLNKIKAIVKTDLETELSELQKQFDAL